MFSFLREMNKAIVPLAFIGHFLNCVGNALLHYIHSTTHQKIFFPKTKAVQI
jgi:hypothetical protein